MSNVPKHMRATEVGKGPAISIMDRTSIFNQDIAREITNLAEEKRIPYQFRRAIAGGNDAYAIHASGEGAKVATISVPCRYIHSSVSVASKSDFENTVKLLVEYLKII
jgi:endoglucanase